MRHVYRALGLLSVAVGMVGIVVPLLPTVPFMLLAAFFFARGNPAWERRLLADPRFGPHIRAWRERGAISRKGKFAALSMLGVSALVGLLLLEGPRRYAPLAVAILCGAWMASRPSERSDA